MTFQDSYYYRVIWPAVVAQSDQARTTPCYDEWGTCHQRQDPETGEWIDLTREESLAYRGTQQVKQVPLHLERKEENEIPT